MVDRLVTELGIGSSVIVRGEVTDAELADLYDGSLATVHASPDEGFGLQPLEAMACGALLISTRATAISEVTDGAVVVWSDPSNEGMALAMETASSQPALRADARRINRACAERFSWDATAATLHHLLTTRGAAVRR
jgi:glycosyltransferase involved in cell wall biosynthesis